MGRATNTTMHHMQYNNKPLFLQTANANEKPEEILQMVSDGLMTTSKCKWETLLKLSVQKSRKKRANKIEVMNIPMVYSEAFLLKVAFSALDKNKKIEEFVFQDYNTYYYRNHHKNSLKYTYSFKVMMYAIISTKGKDKSRKKGIDIRNYTYKYYEGELNETKDLLLVDTERTSMAVYKGNKMTICRTHRGVVESSWHGQAVEGQC
eukprot:1519582-Rhodomonas_salina.1